MARPTKYTPEVEALILDALKSGVSRRAAAEYAGLDEKTVINWMKRYSSFSSAVIAAESRVEIRASLSLRMAFEGGDWRAALAWLERRRHQDWGRKDRVEIINTVRQFAAAEGLSEEETAAAVAEAEAYLKGLRSGSRG